MKRFAIFAAAAFLLAAPKAAAQDPERGADELRGDVIRLEKRVRELEEMVRRLSDRLDAAPARAETAESAPAATPPEAARVDAQPEPEKPGALHAYWKDGLRLDSADEIFKLKLGGRIHNDWAAYSASSDLEATAGPFSDGTEFRRIRLYASGEIFNRVEYKAQYDFASGSVQARDVWVGVKDIPGAGGLRVGHQKEPFSLEELTSSNYITFMERSLANVFAPSRNTGLLLKNTAASDRLTWAVGVFRESDSVGEASGDAGYNFSARLTGLPQYEDGGRKLVHLGVAYSRQNSLLDVVRFRQRPESGQAPRLVDTGLLAARSVDLLGLEAAWVNGPFSLQGEYTRSSVNTFDGRDPSFAGFYVQGSFFVTGENRKYKTSSGAFDRVGPKSFFGQEGGGSGAWEIAARYSYLDLNDSGVQGGRLNDFTFGVNWHLNSNTRVMWNYVFADLDSVGSANVFQTRVQVDF